MVFPKVKEVLESIIKSGQNPFDINYWTPVFFHPYTSLVNGFWFSSANGDMKYDYRRFQKYVDGISELEDYKQFMADVKDLTIEKGWIIPADGMWSKTDHKSHDFDNKVAISLLGKNEEVIVLGWKDFSLCIGCELSKETFTTSKSYNVCH